MEKVINPAYERFGFAIGFIVAIVLFDEYFLYDVLSKNFIWMFIFVAVSIGVGLFGGAIISLIFYKISPQYNSRSNIDALVLSLWHNIAYAVVFWSIFSFPLLILTQGFSSFTIVNWLLIMCMGALMGIGFTFTMLIGGVMRSEIFSILGPIFVGALVGAEQGYLLGTNIIMSSGFGFIMTPISVRSAINAKKRDLEELNLRNI